MASSPSLGPALSIHPAFAVPLGDARHPAPSGLNSSLRELVLGLEAQGYRNPDPLVHQPRGLFESEFDFFARSEPCVQQLRAFCWGALGEFIRNLNPSLEKDSSGLQIQSQTWFHVSRSGGYFGYHNHPMASWSGVYCVADGEPDASIEHNGCLVFPHPLTCSNAYLDATNSSLRWPFTQCNFVLKLLPGQLILFPSWLGHYVNPFHGERERITIAFNAWFQKGS